MLFSKQTRSCSASSQIPQDNRPTEESLKRYLVENLFILEKIEQFQSDTQRRKNFYRAECCESSFELQAKRDIAFYNHRPNLIKFLTDIDIISDNKDDTTNMHLKVIINAADV